MQSEKNPHEGDSPPHEQVSCTDILAIWIYLKTKVVSLEAFTFSFRLSFTPGGEVGGGGGHSHMTGYPPMSKKASKGYVFQPYGIVDVFL